MTVATSNLKKISYLLPLIGLVIVSLTLGVISPEKIIGFVGTSNSYLLMFILAVIGGISTFTGVPYHFILMGLAAGGLNPLLLGFVTAIGVMIGDSTSYLIGKHSSHLLPGKLKKPLEKISLFLLKRPALVSPTLIIYGTLSPFSNDFIVISMGLIGYSYFKVILPLTLGNILYNIGLAYLGLYHFETIQSWM